MTPAEQLAVGLGQCVQPEALGLSLPVRPARGHSSDDLARLACGMTLSPDAWSQLAPFLAFDARQYRRVRLFRDHDWEALLLCWLPGQQTSVHDHGGSVGISLVLSGVLRETRWTCAGAGQPLASCGTGECRPPLAMVEQVDTIHRVQNDSAEPAVSLHLYSPPLRVLGAHDLALGTRWEVPVADSPDVQVGGDPGLVT